jgi:PTS system mannose-specific IIA component/fructoselysine and glucoselysine-specific PTS system IIA component
LAHIILASHGDFAKGVKHALEMIVGGTAEGVETYGLYPGGSAADYVGQVRARVDSSPGERFIVVTDVIGGSVCNEFVSLAGYPNVRIVSGMNLALALDIVMNNEEGCSDSVIENAMAAARKGICMLGREILTERTEEGDF